MRCPPLLAALLVAALQPASAATAAPAREGGPPLLAMGLFPVEDAQGSLSLVFESVEVTPRTEGCEVRRQYRIRCKGGGGAYRLATALLGPDLRPSGIDSTLSISVDGEAQERPIYDGRLLDGGGRVRIADADEEEVRSCWERNPGTICGHTWTEVTLPIGRNQVRTVDLYYRYATPGLDSSLAFAVAHASIYTESFWANSPIPRIEIRLDARGLPIPAEGWAFLPRAGRESIVDYRNEGGVLVSRVRNCRTWKEPGHLPESMIQLSP